MKLQKGGRSLWSIKLEGCWCLMASLAHRGRLGDCGCLQSFWHGVCQGLVRGHDELKVKRLHEDVIIAHLGTMGLQAGTCALVSTGLALELPRESYGRIAGRSSLATWCGRWCWCHRS